MYRVDKAERTNRTGHAYDFCHIIDGSDRIRCVANRDDPGTRCDLTAQVFHIQGAILRIDVGDLDDCTTLCQCLPWRNIRVVVKPGQHNLVTGPDVAADAAW